MGARLIAAGIQMIVEEVAHADFVFKCPVHLAPGRFSLGLQVVHHPTSVRNVCWPTQSQLSASMGPAPHGA